MRAIFVRHKESTGNSGYPCHDLAKLELTEKGWEQARQLADEWTEVPA
jgi:broad specificity phosphatase PhoE